MTQDEAHKLFEYRDGVLFNKMQRGINGRIGERTGTLNQNGYWNVRVNNKQYKNHIIIFLMHHGYLPKFVDHIDGNPLNNKIENLRPATHAENIQNAKTYNTSTTGIRNVSWHKPLNKWRVQLQVRGKKKHIGYFDDLELAELVAIEARDKYHKEFARNG
jgi:hypothetical protein